MTGAGGPGRDRVRPEPVYRVLDLTTATTTTSQGAEPRMEAELARVRRLIEGSRFRTAEYRLSEILKEDLDPYHEVEAGYLLAVSRRYRKDLPGALEALSRLLKTRPDHARAYQEEGYCHLAMNRLDEATRGFANAVEHNPALLTSWKALAKLHEVGGRGERARFARTQADHLAGLPPEVRGAMDLLYEGKLRKAEGVCRRFLKSHPRHVEAMRLLAEVGIRLKVYDDAEFLLESCVEFEPDHIGARMDYLKILNRKSKFAKACEQARILLEKQPQNPAFELSMASALTGLGRFDEGIERYRKSLDRTPDKPGVHVMLGHAHKATGQLDAAIAAYREAYRLRPEYGDAYWSLANTKTYRFGDDEISRMREQADDPEVPVDDRTHLCFALGKACEDRREFAESFEHYRRGNDLKRLRSGYDPALTTEMVDAQIEICTEELFAERGDLGLPVQDPIFILGLPRAGSTLLEQILASHPMVDGTMELHNILGLAQRLRGRSAERNPRYPRILWELDDDYFRRFGEQFVENTRVYRDGALRFIDKMPNNFLHIGLIRLILPNARIIDARRYPMACCFSGYKQLFGEGQDFTYGLEYIGRYYRDYVRLMDHWDRVLPGFVLRVSNEDVIEDLETQVRRMLDFCGLPFDPACLEFHRTKRTVRTPSSEQVRRPVNRTGVDQWRNYEEWLDPLKEALGPEVRERFGVQ